MDGGSKDVVDVVDGRCPKSIDSLNVCYVPVSCVPLVPLLCVHLFFTQLTRSTVAAGQIRPFRSYVSRDSE